jgi:hypothetical protein
LRGLDRIDGPHLTFPPFSLLTHKPTQYGHEEEEEEEEEEEDSSWVLSVSDEEEDEEDESVASDRVVLQPKAVHYHAPNPSGELDGSGATEDGEGFDAAADVGDVSGTTAGDGEEEGEGEEEEEAVRVNFWVEGWWGCVCLWICVLALSCLAWLHGLGRHAL